MLIHIYISYFNILSSVIFETVKPIIVNAGQKPEAILFDNHQDLRFKPCINVGIKELLLQEAVDDFNIAYVF